MEKRLQGWRTRDGNVTFLCSLWLCIALERQERSHFFNSQHGFHRCPGWTRRNVEEDEANKEELRGGVERSMRGGGCGQ